MGIITNKGGGCLMKLLSGFISYFSGFSKNAPTYLSETNYFRPRIKQKSMNRNVKLISILSLGLMLDACSGNSSSQEETITAAGILLQKSIHGTTASGVNVLRPSIARQRQSMNVSVRFIRKTIFPPVLTRRHVRNILLPKLLSTQLPMNWKIPAL